MATELGVPFMEVSAKSGTNVHEAFMSVLTKAVGEHLAREDRKSGGAGVSLERTGKEVGGIQVTCVCVVINFHITAQPGPVILQ